MTDSSSNPPRDPDALVSTESLPATDANGFDPNEFEWRPVPRRPRADGWSPDVQRRFIQVLADTGMVERACEEVDMSVCSAYRLRNAPGSEGFARAWDAAVAAAARRLVDIAFQRVIEGEDIPVFDRDGCRIGSKRRYDNRLLGTLLRAYMPERFRHANQDTRRPDEPPPPITDTVAKAIESLAPVTPPDPHLLTPSDRMEKLIDGARGVAEVYEFSPPDDRERYRIPTVPADHPKTTARARKRRRREYDWRVAEGDDDE